MGGDLFPPHRTPRMVRGRLHQRQKSRDSPIYQRPFSGAPRCALNTPLGEKTLPSRPRLKRVGGMDIGVFTSRCHDGGRWRGGSGQGEDRAPSALAPFRGWSASGGRGLASWELGSAGSAAALSLRLQHAGQRPRRRLIKGSARGHVGSPRPIDVNVHSWGSGRVPGGWWMSGDWRVSVAPGLRLRSEALG